MQQVSEQVLTRSITVLMAQLTTFPNRQVDDLTWLQTHWSKPPQRLFWIYQVAAQQSRGGHRHTSGQMVLRCVVGSVKIYVQTPDQDQWYTLDEPTTCLFANPEDWRLMYDFSPDAVLLVVAEEHYSMTDYIDEPYRPIPATVPSGDQDSTNAILIPLKCKLLPLVATFLGRIDSFFSRDLQFLYEEIQVLYEENVLELIVAF